MTYRFEYDGIAYEAELKVTPGIPPTRATFKDPGDEGAPPELELRELGRVVDGDVVPMAKDPDTHPLWLEIEEWLNEDAEHVLASGRVERRIR